MARFTENLKRKWSSEPHEAIMSMKQINFNCLEIAQNMVQFSFIPSISRIDANKTHSERFRHSYSIL